MGKIDKIRFFGKLYLSMLNKRDKNLIVFGSWFGEKFADNSKALFLYALKNGRNAVWITKNEDVYSKMKDEGYPVEMAYSKKGIAVCSKAGYVVYSTGQRDVNENCIGGAVLINLWHGIPLKKIMHDDRISTDRTKIKARIQDAILKIPYKKEYIFSTSDRISEIYTSAFKTDINHIIQIGQVRNDCFFNGQMKKKIYGNNIAYEKLVVYMPTHRNAGKTAIEIDKIFDLEKLNQYCQKNKCLFMIKKHFYHKNEVVDLSKYSNIVDYTNLDCDTQELLFNADVLITDYSSCYIDYLLLDKPVIFYCYDYANYLENDRDMYFEYDSVTPGPKVKDKNDFLVALNSSLNGNSEYRDKIQEVKNLLYSKDNQCAVCEKTLLEMDKIDE